MRSLLMQAAENVTHLASQENWKLEFIESHGSITQLVIRHLYKYRTIHFTIELLFVIWTVSLMFLKRKSLNACN